MLQILGFSGMYFDATVVFVTSRSFFIQIGSGYTVGRRATEINRKCSNPEFICRYPRISDVVFLFFCCHQLELFFASIF